MRHIIVKFTAAFLTAMLLMSYCFEPQKVSAASTQAPENLKVNLLNEAYGIPTENPSFSWTFKGSGKNEKQTAYEIIVSSSSDKAALNDGDVADTGKVESNESSDVKIDGLNLSDNSLYYWKVKIWYSNGTDKLESNYSQPSAITTAVGSDWAGSEAVWSGDTNYSRIGWSDYSIDVDMKIVQNRTGIIFRMSNDGENFYMWQFSASENSFCPHICKNGVYKKLSSVSLSKKGITLKQNQYYHVKITALNNSINTYLNNKLVSSETRSDFKEGTIGTRNGATETAKFKNFKVTRLTASGNSAERLYSSSFASGKNDFTGGTLSGNELNLGKSHKIALPVFKDNFVFLRHKFSVTDTSKIEKAIVSVTASNSKETKQYIYDLHLNGKSVGVGPVRPIGDEIRYNTYDVTSLLQNGTNVIGAINYTVSGKQFLLQMTVFYKDGSKEILLNSGRDGSKWLSIDGTKAFGDNGVSVGTSYYTQAAENIDAASFPYGWDSDADFDDSDWSPVKSAGNISVERLVPSTVSNVTKFEQSPVSVTEKGDGGYFIDFGKEVIGQISLTLTSTKASQITVRYGEETDGTNVKYKLKAGNTYQEFWNLKNGPQTITTFGMKCYRYVEILNSPVEITAENIKAISTREAFDSSESDFTSSDSLLNKIYDTCKYTIEETDQDLHVDSQLRERKPYQGDELINMFTSYTVNSDAALPRYTTEYLINNSTWPAEYKLFNVILCWEDYMNTGNIDLLKLCYDNLKNNYLYGSLFDSKYGLLKCSNSGRINNDSILVDWPECETDKYVFDGNTYNTVFNAVAYGAYKDMSLIAGVLGKAADADNYANIAAKIKRSLVSRLYNASMGAFSDGLKADGSRIEHYSQHASAFALAFGIADDAQQKSNLAYYIGKGGKFKTSVYGAFFVLSGLYNADSGYYAKKLMTSNDKNSWYNMIDKCGATITAESWNPSIKQNMTYSHPWGSAAAGQIKSGIFGIKPIAPGYSEFQIKFQPSDLKNASITVPTVKGSIKADFDTSQGFSANVTIPFNTTAEVYIPETDNAVNTLNVDGSDITASRDGDYLKIQLGSGEHTVSYIDSTAPVFGTPVFSTTEKTCNSVKVKIPVKGAVFPCMEHTFDENGSYTFIAYDNAGNKAEKTVTVNNIINKVTVNYKGHVQRIGWQNTVSDGKLCGTTGRSLQLEAIKINLENAPKGLKIKYKVHVQKKGWLNWNSEGSTAGTVGQKLGIEAIQIELEGPNSNLYNVSYQVHVAKLGWLNWSENGEMAGTTGRSLQIQAIRINITSKN